MTKRSGFRVKPTIFRLQFEDEQFDGLEIEARSMPLSEFFELQEMQAKAETDPEAARKVIATMAEAIIGWNVEDEDGNPVKPTADGLAQLEIGLVMAIMTAWTEAIAAVPNRLRAASSNGATSPELSIPMELS